MNVSSRLLSGVVTFVTVVDTGSFRGGPLACSASHRLVSAAEFPASKSSWAFACSTGTPAQLRLAALTLLAGDIRLPR
jgi:hypothetical protein